MNFGSRVGTNGWGGPNIGKQAISRTLEPGNTGKQTILRTQDPGNTAPQPMFRSPEPRNFKINITYAYTLHGPATG